MSLNNASNIYKNEITEIIYDKDKFINKISMKTLILIIILTYFTLTIIITIVVLICSKLIR